MKSPPHRKQTDDCRNLLNALHRLGRILAELLLLASECAIEALNFVYCRYFLRLFL